MREFKVSYTIHNLLHNLVDHWLLQQVVPTLRLYKWFPDHGSNVESSVPKTDDLPINLSGIIWYSLKDLNLRPVPCKGTTLPTELSEHGGSNKTSNLYLSQNKGVMLLVFTRTFNPLLINCTSVNVIPILISIGVSCSFSSVFL